MLRGSWEGGGGGGGGRGREVKTENEARHNAIEPIYKGGYPAKTTTPNRAFPLDNQHTLLLTPGKAAHDTGPTEEPQEADKPDDGQGGSRVQQELEEPGRALRRRLLEGGKKKDQSQHFGMARQKKESNLPRCQTN